MEFATFADRAETIDAEPADLEIVDQVRALFEDAGDDLEIVVRFVQGRVVPAWDSTTLDIGPRTCYEAVARAAGTNVDADDVEDRLADLGEIGDVAASYDFGGQQGLGAFTGGETGHDTADGTENNGTSGLTVHEVDETLAELAAANGAGSQDRKVDLLFGLFNRCSSVEARYLSRLVLSEMRIGVGEGTVRDAIAEAFDVPDDRVERALQVSNDYGRVARVARDEGLEGLDAMDLEIGRPVQAMLAQAGTVMSALEDWDEAGVEWKYDGARIQLHHEPPSPGSNDASGATDAATTRVYSRNMEDVTDALPEVVEFAEETLEEPAILDGEVVAVDDAGEPLPFQEVLKRFRRKHDVAKAREEVAVRPVFFDCLHADGEDLLAEPLTTRHERLEGLLSTDRGHDPEDVDGLSLLWTTDDPETIESIDANALEDGHEGIMLKDPDSTYSPGRRGKHWRKRKPDVETLDCVVTGAEWGEGRRATFLGTFELSVRDGDDSEERRSAGSVVDPKNLATVGKVATGITDETLAELTELLEPHIVAEDGQDVDLEPAVVFEVGYEEIQSSPTYSSGYALRFPRFVGVRHDKSPNDADTLDRVASLR